MALETIKELKNSLNGEITHLDENTILDISLPCGYIVVDTISNSVSFKLQNGPIKEVGVNGVQIDDMIYIAMKIIEGLNKNFPCDENKNAFSHLKSALSYLELRKIRREKQGNEGINKEIW